MNKTKVLIVRVSEKEKAEIISASEKYGYTISELLRAGAKLIISKNERIQKQS